jgi:phenylacetate-CoA ligase
VSGIGGLGKTLYDHAPVWVQNELCTLWGRQLEAQRYGPAYDRWAAAWAEQRGWGEERLRAFQLERLRELLEHCAASVPYYTERWRAAGVKPADLASLDDLARFPDTTKDDLFDAGERMISDRVDRGALVTITTGGTTGQPLTLHRTREELQAHYAAFWDRMRPGITRGERYAAFQGKEVVPASQSKPPYWRDNRAANQRLYSMRHLSPAKLEAYARDLERNAFAYYQGYANFMAVIAEYMADHGITPRTPPRAVFSTSDQLSANTRRLFETTWKTRVWDEYGQAEYASLLLECEHGTRHAQMDYGVIEYLPAGEEGGLRVAEMVCTGFIPRAMPLIRYRVGDHVLIDPGATCPCGRPGPVIRAIRGRTSEFIVTPDGRRYPTITHFVDLLRHVRRTQVVQETAGEIVVRVLPEPGFSEADAAHARRLFEDRVGGGIRVRVEAVAELERMPNGKVLNIINRMPGYRAGRITATGDD